MVNKINTLNQDHDSPWKEALELRFPEFLALLFPDVHQLVDWVQPIRFLDKELQQILPNAENGRTYTDKLVQVAFKDGLLRWVLIHVEVQGEPEADFAQRMFKYNYRIRDKYDKDVVSLAVLSDTSEKFRPNQFEFKLVGCEISFKFPTVKLLDWKDRLEELHTSENVFALIVAAQLQAKLLKEPSKQLNAKAYLIRLLYQRGYSQAQLLELFRLIDWMIRLPDNLEIEFKQIVDQIEEVQNMAYITSVERIAMQQGMQQGKLELAIQMVRDFNLPVQAVAEKYQLSLNEILAALKPAEDTKH